MHRRKRNIIFILLLTLANFLQLQAQQDYSKWRILDTGIVDFTHKNTQFISKASFELPWLYQGKIDSIQTMPCSPQQEYRYSFVQDTAGNLRYYADYTGVYSNQSGVLFKSFNMNTLALTCPSIPWSAKYFKIPGKPDLSCFPTFNQRDSLENHGYSNCVRFGKSNQYGVGIWDYLNNGFRLLHLQYDPISGDKILSSALLPNAGQLTSITCGPTDSTFWIVSILNNKHTVQVFLWSTQGVKLKQTFELGDTSNSDLYSNRMKFSPDNTKIILLKRSDYFSPADSASNNAKRSYLFDFDQQTGNISNQQSLKISGRDLAFSPNSKLIYITIPQNNGAQLPQSQYRNLYRYNISSQTLKLVLNDSFYAVNMQLMPDGNIYLHQSTYSDSQMYYAPKLKYRLARLENANDTQNIHFNWYRSALPYDVNFSNKINNRSDFLFCPEIPICKCLEPEKASKIGQFCFSGDTIAIENKFRKYDSLRVSWGDGNFTVYPNIQDTLYHGYAKNGQYAISTSYSSVFQDFEQLDTVIFIQNNHPSSLRDTFYCTHDSLFLNLALEDSNLIWASTGNAQNWISQPGKYAFTYRDNWCNFRDSIAVKEQLQSWNLPFNDTVLCAGQKAVIAAPKHLKLQWDDNIFDTVSTKEFTVSGKHRFTFADGVCRYSDSLTVTVLPPINLTIKQLDTNVCFLFDDLSFEVSGNLQGAKWVEWNSTRGNSLRYSTRETEVIRVTTTDSFGCTETAFIAPKSRCNSRIYIPNAFTPDGYGPAANERFKPVIEDGKLKRFRIYNRWGELIFEDSGDAGWDGKVGGIPAIDGVYLYEIEVMTALNQYNYVQRFFGNVHLVR